MKILLADDHALFSQGMIMIIKSVLPNSQIICVPDWNHARNSIQQNKFDIALLDLFMPRENTWEDELKTFIEYKGSPSVCVISSSGIQSHIKVALEIGAKGFIHKTSGIKEMKKALLLIQQGGYYAPDQYQVNACSKGDVDTFTLRQKEVLSLMVEGKSNKEIGLRLGVTEATVKRHVYNIFQLLNVNNRLQAAKIVDEQGLLCY